MYTVQLNMNHSHTCSSTVIPVIWNETRECLVSKQLVKFRISWWAFPTPGVLKETTRYLQTSTLFVNLVSNKLVTCNSVTFCQWSTRDSCVSTTLGVSTTSVGWKTIVIIISYPCLISSVRNKNIMCLYTAMM